MSAGLNLTGNISLNAEPAIHSAQALGQKIVALAGNSRTASATMQGFTDSMLTAAKAADIERGSIGKLAIAQQRAAAIQRESAAKAAVPRARARAVASDASNRVQIAEGQRVLLQNRAISETIKQRIALQDADGRSAVRSSQMAATAARTRIQEERLSLSQQRAAAAEARSANAAVKESLGTARGAISSLGSASTRFGVITGAMFVGFAANAIVMEREFANVVRTSDILDQHLSKLGQKGKIDSLRLQFDALAQELPVTYKELTQIGAAANQLGVSSTHLASFTKTVAMFSAVTGVSVDQASMAFGRLDSLIVNTGGRINGVNHNYIGLADAINKVGVNSVATDQEIINISAQIAGIANAAGLGYKDIIGFGGALASVKVSPFLARGLTTRLFTDIGSAVNNGGIELQKFGAVSELGAKRFANAWRTDPQKALVALLDGIHRSGGRAVDVLKSLGVTSVLDQPALVRLANAADKTGKAGGLIKQTFHDANTALGENARQYAVIANTVQARLQVALNRVQIMFRNIAAANLGPLGDAISGVSDNVLKLSQNLDKPFKLFGILPNFSFFDKTNGEILGMGVAALGLVSVFTLLVGAASKVVAAIIALRQAQMAVSGWLGRGAAAASEQAAANNADAAATERLAAAQNRLRVTGAVPAGSGGRVNYQTGLAASTAINETSSMFSRGSIAARAYQATVGRVTGAISSGFGRMGSAYTSAVGRMQASGSGFVRGLGAIGVMGTGAFSKVASGARRALGGIRALGSGISGLVGGPFGMAALIALAGGAWLNALNDDMRKLGSSVGDVSTNLINANKQLDILSNVKVSAAGDPIVALFDKRTQSYMQSNAAFKTSLNFLGSGGFINDFIAKIGIMDGGLNKGFNYTTDGLDKINNGFKNLAESGNVDGAIHGIQTLFKGLTDQQTTNALAHMPDVVSTLTEKLNENGLTAGKNDKNIKALAHSNAILGAAQQKAAANSDALTQAFNGDTAAATEYLDAVKTAADASVDLNKAWNEAGKLKSKDPFGAFVKQAKKNFADFQNVEMNALKIANDTGASMSDLAKLDPGILAGAVKGGKKDEKLLVGLMGLPDVKDTLVASVAAIGNNPALNHAFQALPANAKKIIMDGFRKGLDLQDAFAAAGPKAVAAFNRAIQGTKITPIKIPQPHKVTIVIGADALPARKIGQSAADWIKHLKGTLMVDGNPAPAIKKGESARAYVNRLHGRITIEANNLPAIRKGESAKAYINRIHGRLTVDGKNAPAIHSGESAKHYIDRLRGTINVGANTQPARDAINAVVNQRRTATVQLILGKAPAPPPLIAAPHRATGGLLLGPGSGTSDSIPALLSNGEYIVRASQTRKYKNLLDSINYGLQGYAGGGMVNHYESTNAAQSSVVMRERTLIEPGGGITELSPYDRHLLQQIADNIGVTIAPTHIAQAQHTVNRTQARRGNG